VIDAREKSRASRRERRRRSLTFVEYMIRKTLRYASILTKVSGCESVWSRRAGLGPDANT
jgi:hypothetical protein